MTTLRATLPDLYDERQATIFATAFMEIEMVWEKLLPRKSVTMGHDDAFRLSGLGTFVLKAEGGPISQSDPVQGARRREIIETFALQYRHSMEAMEDKRYPILDQMPKDLGTAGREHMENLAHGPFNEAFTSTTFLGLDGLTWASASHPLLKPQAGGATTDSNLLSPGVAVSVTGLEQAFTRMRLTLSEEGRRIGQQYKPTTLVIHPNQEHEAARVLESEFEPGTGDNQINTMRSSRTGVKPIGTAYKTDTDSWHLLADKSKIGAYYLDRKKLTFDRGGDMNTKDRVYDGHYRAKAVVREWRGSVHSNPS
jgi:hypothetical protein